MANYIFDFDGTIADNFSLVCKMLSEQSKALNCKAFSLSDTAKLREMHAREMLKHLEVPFWKTPFFVKKFKKLLNEHVREIEIFPKWHELLKKLKEQGHVIGIVSSNSEETITALLKEHCLLDWFDFVLSNQSLFGKKRSLKKIIQAESLNPKNTYYIGDEVRDIEAARANQIHSIAVSWGFNSEKRLLEAVPEKLVNSMEELERVLCDGDIARSI